MTIINTTQRKKNEGKSAMADNIKLCYSFSARIDKLGFIDLLHSLHTAKRYFTRDDIIIFSTPPYSDDYEREFNKYAQVVRKPHYPIPHPTFDPNDPTPPFYWDKYYFTEVDCENLIFLDNDTEVQHDIRDFYNEEGFKRRCDEMLKTVDAPNGKTQIRNLDSDFDILVFGNDMRIDAGFNDIWSKTWVYLNMSTQPIRMTTAIIFKNRTHTKLKEEIARFANAYMDGTLTIPAEDRLFDEYIFTLAARNFNIQVTPKDVDMLWTSVQSGGPFLTRRKTATILHGGARRLLRAGNYPDNIESFDTGLLEQIKNNVPLKHWIERVAATFLAMLEDIYSGFNIHFSLEGNTVVMHTNVKLSNDIIEQTMDYVWAEKPKQFKFIVKGDLKK